ncbi:Protein O-mannosyl-transferase tmtc3 [Cichlidogyrus casuarinus]|uniref:dolichyl-phosphate-mannose--protein mannosyltransferase n=1 Tax=Cichlidogyrus casuarinus TaxID=1844966 RepID=A0ABD2PWS5_9PLAT
MHFSNVDDFPILALAFILNIAIYHNALDCGLVFDDTAAITNNPDVTGKFNLTQIFLNDFWGTPMLKEESHGSYRPFVVITFKINHYLDDLNPYGYHLFNVILHYIVTVLVFFLSKRFLSPLGSAISALLFLSHPVHVEAVTGVVGRAELLSALFFLVNFLYYLKISQYDFSLKIFLHLLIFNLIVSVGTLCKEVCITVIGVCALYDVFIVWQRFSNSKVHSRQLKMFCFRLMCLTLFLITFVYVRVLIMGLKLPVFSKHSNPASYADPLSKILTYSYLVPLNLCLLFWPMHLCCDWSMGSIPLVKQIIDIRNICTLLAFVVIFVVFIFSVLSRKGNPNHRRNIFISLILLIVPFVPSSNLFFPVGFVLAERVLYIPSIGFCFFIGILHDLLSDLERNEIIWKSRKRYFQVFLIAYLTIFANRAYLRNFDWKNEYSLFTSGVRVNPGNAKLWNNIGHSIEAPDANNSMRELALFYFQRAAIIQPDDFGAHMNVARSLIALNRSSDAEASYKLALQYAPKLMKGKSYQTRVDAKLLSLYIEYSSFLSKNESRLEEAESLLKKCISMRKGNSKAHQNLAALYLRQNKTEESLAQLKIALEQKPDDPDNLYNLGAILVKHGNKDTGLEYLRKAIERDANHKHALFAMATALAELNKTDEAMKTLTHLVDLKFEQVSVSFTLGMLRTDLGQHEEALKDYLRVLAVDAAHVGALFNAALLLTNELHRPREAMPLLENLLKSNPNHYKSCLLLGDLLLTEDKNFERAEKLFQKSLSLRPNDLQAEHNLCVLYANRGETQRSFDCLRRLLQKNPNDQNLVNSFNILKQKIAN